MVPLSQGHFLCYPVADPVQVLICWMNEFSHYSGCHDWDVRLSQWGFVILCGILDASLHCPSLSVHINPISWGQTLNERPKVQLGIWLSSYSSWALIAARKQTLSGIEPSSNSGCYSFSRLPWSFITNDRNLLLAGVGSHVPMQSAFQTGCVLLRKQTA